MTHPTHDDAASLTPEQLAELEAESNLRAEAEAMEHEAMLAAQDEAAFYEMQGGPEW